MQQTEKFQDPQENASGWTPQQASFHHLNSEDYYLAIKGCTYKGIHAMELPLSYFQMYFTYFQMYCAPPS